MKLYEITERYNNIAEILSNPDFAECQETIADALEQIKDEFGHKAENVAYAIKNAESEIVAIDNEIKRLQAMKKQRQNGIERIKAYLKSNMEQAGIDQVKCRFFNIRYRRQELGAVELDEDLFLGNNVDEDLVRVKITPNKAEIKNRLKQGEEIIGAKLVDSQVLTIS